MPSSSMRGAPARSRTTPPARPLGAQQERPDDGTWTGDETPPPDHLRGDERSRAPAVPRAGRRKGHPPAWQPPPPEVRELQGLVRRIDDLVEMAAREKGRLSSPA